MLGTKFEDEWIGLGVVARNEYRHVLWSACRRVRAWWSVAMVEGKALCLAIQLARLHHHSHVTFETDCSLWSPACLREPFSSLILTLFLQMLFLCVMLLR